MDMGKDHNGTKKVCFLATAMFFALLAGAQPLVVRHLSGTHSMVRVNGNERYLLLPVQESAPETSVRVISGGRELKAFNVRLAVESRDYSVPLDMEPFEGQPVVLDIRTSGKKDYSDAVCWKEMELSSTFDKANRERFRPEYHFSPAYGWMNDPNGMVYKDGEWHLFFQYNPYGSVWGNMTWGHAVSRDLIRWEELPNAICPDALGAVFSGSAVVDKDNVSGFGKGAIVAMFTSAGASQTQSLAYSNDGGRTFTKYSGNPVIVSDVPDFRDPKMIFDERTGQWKVILAAGQEVRFYSSDNLRDWTFESSFGKGYGCHDGVWECPDLVRLPAGDKEKYVLLLNINPGGPSGGSATQYFVGEFDGHRFICDDDPSVTRWMDYGKDHYATVTWSNAPGGRTVALAWMSNWQYANAVPTKQFRSANSVPRDLGLVERGGETILVSSPSPELEALRGKPVRIKPGAQPKNLFDNPRNSYEIVLKVNATGKGRSGLVLSNGNGEEVRLTFDSAARSFSMDRTRSGEVGFSDSFPCVTEAPTRIGGKMELRIFVDAASIEVFGQDFCMTNLVFPSIPYNSVRTEGGLKAELILYPLNK